MEDDILVRSDGFDGFYFAAVFDGHGGLSSVKFLRLDYMEICVIKLRNIVFLFLFVWFNVLYFRWYAILE